MRHFLVFCIFLMPASILFPMEGKRLVILHTNDMHSCLEGFGPEADYSPLSVNDDKTYGGFSRIAAVVEGEKMKSPGKTLVLDAGDFLMGTLFQAIEEKNGFQLTLMKKMGYDVTCIGNHEYDFGPGTLASILSAAGSSGDIPQILYGNAAFSTDDPADDGLHNMVSGGVLKSEVILDVNEIRIGIFSVLGNDAVSVAPNAKPVVFENQVRYAKKMVKSLRAQGCELVICLSHSGLKKDEDGSWYGEDIDLAEKVDGLNLIISGHTHTLVNNPILVNGVHIVQAGDNGNWVGRLELMIEGDRAEIESYRLIPVDDSIMGNAEIENLINEQKNLITSQLLSPIGLTYDAPVAESGIKLEDSEFNEDSKNNLGPMVADAVHYFVNKFSKEGCDMSMVSAGVLREKILPGKITVPDIFRVVSLGSGEDDLPGYPLSRIYVTGRELKNVLEVLLIASGTNHDYQCYYSGIRVEYDPGKGFLRKISNLKIERDGKMDEVDFSKKNRTLYSVSANSYMLAFIGIIKKKTFGLAKVIPKEGDGGPVTDMKRTIIDFDEGRPGVQEGKEWLALLDYIRQMDDINGNGLPDIDGKYSVPDSRFTVVKH